MKYIREKKVFFGDGYMDADIYEMDDTWEPPSRKAKKHKPTPPHIIAANDRHSKNHLRQLIVNNFSAGDYYLTPTYGGEAPELETAQTEIRNYIRRLQRAYAKSGRELRAVYVTEGGRLKKDGTRTRVHHHLVINSGITREEVEKLWNGTQPRGVKYTRGFCNAAVMKPADDERGVERVAEYMAKSRTKNLGKGLRRWNGTRNLKRPTEWVHDNKFSAARTAELVEEAAKLAELLKAKKEAKTENTEALRRILERRYRRELIDVITSVSPVTGRVYISARFRQKWQV